MSIRFELYYDEGKRGLAEKIRLLLAETGYKYEDIGTDEATFDAMKQDSTIKFGALPVLRDCETDEYVEMSNVIMEHIAQLADKEGRGQGTNKFCGESGDVSKVRAIATVATEFHQKANISAGKDAKPANLDDLIKEYFTYFSTVLSLNDDDDVRTSISTVGENMTFADISVFEVVNAICSMHGVSKVRPYPKLKEFHDKMALRARLDKRLSSRPDGF
eukprot:m.332671 g.332671  ORF g.332671 m.332671 type:complete len:218 (+) comp16985_c0_seq1:92-745(+)